MYSIVIFNCGDVKYCDQQSVLLSAFTSKNYPSIFCENFCGQDNTFLMT